MSIYLAIFLVTFLFALLFTPLAGRAGHKMGTVDKPRELSIHTETIPRSGGLVFFFAFLLPSIYLITNSLLTSLERRLLAGIMGGGLFIFAIGLLDDLKEISPLKKFIWEIIASIIPIAFGLHFGFLPQWWISLPLTIFYLVGGANALNLSDGMDGLATGMSAIILGFFSLLSLSSGNHLALAISLILLGISLGFLYHNFYPAKIFLGDGGSLFLGFNLACIALIFSNRPYDFKWVLAPLLILFIPVADTASALLRRFREKRDLFTGDRSHIYDILQHKILNKTTEFYIKNREKFSEIPWGVPMKSGRASQCDSVANTLKHRNLNKATELHPDFIGVKICVNLWLNILKKKGFAHQTTVISMYVFSGIYGVIGLGFTRLTQSQSIIFAILIIIFSTWGMQRLWVFGHRNSNTKNLPPLAGSR
ncbi:MAG: MraY family glycosyltransferase [Candidatus Edwardsbacteria bacterium]